MVAHGVKQKPFSHDPNNNLPCVFLIRLVTAERHSDDGVPADVLVSTMRTVTWRILPPVFIPLYNPSPIRHSKSHIVVDDDGDQSVDADTAYSPANQRYPRVGPPVMQFRCVTPPFGVYTCRLACFRRM